MNYYGAIEAGGTKFVCMISSGPYECAEEIRFPTTKPDETLDQCASFFLERAEKYSLKTIGIGTFGPVDLNPKSPTYGYITATPKPFWANTDFCGTLQKKTGLDIAFDSDVNAAAIAEYKWGNPENVSSLVYFTIGTGVGAGIIVDGKPIHGLVHPEFGHILIRQDQENFVKGILS